MTAPGPITIRCDSSFARRRLTVDEDRLLLETQDMIVGSWTTERIIHLDDVELAYLFRRPARLTLLWLALGVPLLGGGIAALPGVPGIVLAALGAGIVALSVRGGLRARPWLRLRDRGGEDLDVRMDRPLLRPGKRRAFFRAVLEPLGLPPPEK